MPAIAGPTTTEGSSMPTGIYPRRSIVADRLRWLAPHIVGFRLWLEQRGYRAGTIVEIVRLLSHWAEWARAAGFELATIEAGFAASAAVFKDSKAAGTPLGAARLFIAWLRATGTLQPEPRAPSPEEIWPVLAAYGRWMREQRGIAESTLASYRGILIDLLQALG